MDIDSINEYPRRDFLKVIGKVAFVTALKPGSVLSAPDPVQTKLQIYRFKAMGCFMGAAIADAMGGPVECQHFKRIAKYFPDFQEHLSYNMPPATFMKLRPGWEVLQTIRLFVWIYPATY